MFKPFDITLDISKKSLNDMFEVSSNDLNTIRLDMKIKEGLQPFDLTGKIVRLAIKKPDGNVVFQTGGVTGAETGLCEVILSRQANVVEGRHEAELMIYQGDIEVAVTTKFYYNVRKAIMSDDNVKSASDFPAIQQAINAGEKLEGIDLDIVADAGGKVQDIQAQVDQLVIEGDSSVEAAQMRVDAKGVAHVTAKARVDSDYNEVTKGIKDTQKINPQDFEYWNPPTQPATSTFKPNNYNEWISKWDAFQTQFPSYVTKEKFGVDQTGVFDMFFYALTPEDGYEKTMIIEACLHGNEKMGTYGLYRFTHHLLHDWKKYPQLGYLRNKVRLILIPVANPYGFEYNTRRNGNPVIMGGNGEPGVDLNRNFNTDWDKYNSSTYPKGSAVYSEKETQAIRDLLIRFKDAVAFIDLHTIITNSAMYITYMPRFSDATFDEVSKYTEYRYKKDKEEFGFAEGYQQMDFATAKLPSAKCHAAINHDMNAMTVEYRNQLFSPTWGDSLEMTKALEWFGNLIIINSKLKTKPKFEVLKDPAVRLVTFEAPTQAEEINITGINTYVSLDRVEDSFEVTNMGILTVEGYVWIRLGAEATIDLQSWVYQRFSPDFSSSKTSNSANSKFNTTVKVLPAGVHQIPILVAMRVYPTTKNLVNSSGSEYKSKEVKVRFRARRKGPNGETTGVPSMAILGYRVKSTYLPSDRGEGFIHLDASNYVDESSNPVTPTALRKLYPPITSLDDNDEGEGGSTPEQ